MIFFLTNFDYRYLYILTMTDFHYPCNYYFWVNNFLDLELNFLIFILYCTCSIKSCWTFWVKFFGFWRFPFTNIILSLWIYTIYWVITTRTRNNFWTFLYKNLTKLINKLRSSFWSYRIFRSFNWSLNFVFLWSRYGFIKLYKTLIFGFLYKAKVTYLPIPRVNPFWWDLLRFTKL